MKKYRAYLLDFDGTAFDTEASLYPVYRAAFATIGMDCSKEQASRYLHMALPQTVAERHVDPKDFAKFGQALAEAIDSPEALAMVKPFPELGEFLKRIHEMGIPALIVTGNTETHVKKLLSIHRLSSYIRGIVGYGDYQNPKPSGEPCLVGCQKLGLSPSHDVVYVGDSLQDIASGNHAGIDAVLIDHENANPEFHGAKISSLLELLD